MSMQDCMVCDECGKHRERPSDRLMLLHGRGLESMLPPGWWTFKPQDQAAVAWLTFCGPLCVMSHLAKQDS